MLASQLNPGARDGPPGPGGQPGRPALAVLVHEFPKLSETFVLSDLLALEAAGVRLALFSLRRPQTAVAQDDVARLRARPEYLPEPSGRAATLLLRAITASLALRDPRRFARGLAEIYASPDFSRLRLRQALLLAHQLHGAGAPALYIHFAHRPATVGRFAARLLGIPYAISAHAVDIWTSSDKELRPKVRDAEVVLTCYAEAQQHLARLAAGRTPVELAYHGVEVPATAPRSEQTPPVVLAVGRLIEKKGLDTLIDAVGELVGAGVDVRLQIAGDGPLWPELQRRIGARGIGEQVRFLGPLNHAELESHYARASVFALPCRIATDGNRDGLPNTLLEAMARGLPVVSTRLPSIREAVPDDACGLLVDPDRADQLAAALRRLIEDPQLRARVGAAGRDRIREHFDRRLFTTTVHGALSRAGLLNGV